MIRTVTAIAAVFAATPALAAKGPFFSFANSDFVVLIAFTIFIGVLVYFKVPSLLGGMLDKRAEGIRSEIAEARKLREEAQIMLAEFERKQREVAEQSERIVAHAKEEAELAAEQAKADMELSLARRLRAAEDQIASAEASAVREVRDLAVNVAVAAARAVIAKQMTAADANRLIEASIGTVEEKLH